MFETCIYNLEKLLTDCPDICYTELSDSRTVKNLKGYLSPEAPDRLMNKKDLKDFLSQSAPKMGIEKDPCLPLRVICMSYSLRDKVEKHKKKEFQKFEIELITKKEIPLLKVNIAW